jgi:hypothetical protein
VTIDPFHQKEVAQRFNDDEWKLHGYVVPILFPAVGDWSWSAIADLRRAATTQDSPAKADLHHRTYMTHPRARSA